MLEHMQDINFNKNWKSKLIMIMKKFLLIQKKLKNNINNQ